MDSLDVIRYLANAEARNFRPLSESSYTDTDTDIDAIQEQEEQEQQEQEQEQQQEQQLVPCLRIRKSTENSKTYIADMLNYKGHDNEGRAPFVCSFLERDVLPHVDPEINVSGLYPMELHDSYTYLNPLLEHNASKYRSVLTFSKDMSHRHTILFPDPYQIAGYGGMLGVSDTIDFDRKQDVMLFAGTTTGSRNPSENVRIKACLWALTRRPRYQFYISNIAQMSLSDMAEVIPRDSLSAILLPRPVTLEEHHKQKYILNIQGNTCCWSRVPMIMNSQSLMINLKHRDGTWYYPLLQDGVHCVNVSGLDNLEDAYNKCASNPTWCKYMINNANAFVKRYCSKTHAAFYTKCLFEAMATNQ